MNIKYRQLKAFALAGRFGSFAQAARALSITQPSFSVLIRELEHDLGMQLFERTTRTCRMTSAGASLYQEIRPVLHDLEEVYQHGKEISAGKRGRLAIAALPSLAFGIMTKALGEYHRMYPDVRIQLREEANAFVTAAVRQNEVELGVASLLVADSELTFKPLFSDRLVVVAPHGHPAMQASMTWKTIGKHPLILLGSGTAERALQLSNSNIKPAFEVAHMATAMAMVRHRMGITLIPSSALDGLNTIGLQCIPMAGALAKRELGVFYRSRKPLSAAANAFIEVLRATVPIDGQARRLA
jgi:DNA-binding transcriptional LysR family regulator